ncbi:MAG: tetratricopeptide repeat protein [Gemmatimonadales bacterium]
MATRTMTPARPATEGEAFPAQVIGWVRAHRRIATWIVTALVLGVGLLVWTVWSNRRSEVIARRELQGARFAWESQNLPLAASELARIVANYAGTNAAEEARILLAQVRLQQGQPQQAVDALLEFVSGASDAYAAKAYGLLAAAYENLGKPREAASAYQEAASRARMPFLKAQMLADAGRAWRAAADTTRAIAAYRRVIDEFPTSGALTEAKVRLGELTKGTP